MYRHCFELVWYIHLKRTTDLVREGGIHLKDQRLINLTLFFFQAKQPAIRANTIIALGDLTFRFPNLIEPWTTNLYARYECLYILDTPNKV